MPNIHSNIIHNLQSQYYHNTTTIHVSSDVLLFQVQKSRLDGRRSQYIVAAVHNQLDERKVHSAPIQHTVTRHFRSTTLCTQDISIPGLSKTKFRGFPGLKKTCFQGFSSIQTWLHEALHIPVFDVTALQ